MIGEERPTLGARGAGSGEESKGGDGEGEARLQNTLEPAMPLVMVRIMILMSNHMDQFSM